MAIISSTNSTPTDSSTAMYDLKTTLVSAGWTVSQSGTGTAGTYNSSGDSITSAAVLATANAWFMLEITPPGGIARQAFFFQNGNNNREWRILWSGDGSSIATDGSATAFPTVTNGVYVRGSSGGYDTQFLPTNASYYWNVIADNAAPYGFWFAAIPFSPNYAASGMIFDPLTAVSSGDTSPYVTFACYTDGSTGYFGSLYNSESSRTGTSAAFLTGYVASTTSGATVKEFPMFQPYATTDQGNRLLLNNSSVNPITGYDESYPVMYARSANASGGDTGWKGVSTFLRIKGISRSFGDTYSVTTTRDRFSANGLSLPWDGSVPVL